MLQPHLESTLRLLERYLDSNSRQGSQLPPLLNIHRINRSIQWLQTRRDYASDRIQQTYQELGGTFQHGHSDFHKGKRLGSDRIPSPTAEAWTNDSKRFWPLNLLDVESKAWTALMTRFGKPDPWEVGAAHWCLRIKGYAESLQPPG
jgi:hypothetical protein